MAALKLIAPSGFKALTDWIEATRSAHMASYKCYCIHTETYVHTYMKACMDACNVYEHKRKTSNCTSSSSHNHTAYVRCPRAWWNQPLARHAGRARTRSSVGSRRRCAEVTWLERCGIALWADVANAAVCIRLYGIKHIIYAAEQRNA